MKLERRTEWGIAASRQAARWPEILVRHHGYLLSYQRVGGPKPRADFNFNPGSARVKRIISRLFSSA